MENKNKNGTIFIVLIIIAVIMMVVGVVMYMTSSGTSKDLDLTKASTSLMELESTNIDRFVAEEKVTALGNESLNNMMYVYDYEIPESGIDFTVIEEYTIKKNDTTKELFAMIKPMEGEIENVKTVFSKYAETIVGEGNIEVHERGEYLVFLGTSINEEVLTAVSMAYAPIFSGVQALDKDATVQVLGLTTDTVSEAMMLQSMLIVNSTTVVAVKPVDGQEESVKEKIEEYFETSEEQWKTYLVDQYEIIKDRKVEEYGDYLIYIATDNQNDKVYETIINSVIEE